MRPDRDLPGHRSLSGRFTRKISASRPEDTGRRGSDDSKIVSRPLDLWIERARRAVDRQHTRPTDTPSRKRRVDRAMSKTSYIYTLQGVEEAAAVAAATAAVVQVQRGGTGAQGGAAEADWRAANMEELQDHFASGSIERQQLVAHSGPETHACDAKWGGEQERSVGVFTG